MFFLATPHHGSDYAEIHGKKTSLSLGDSLRSLAYQLAAGSAIIRETLVAIHDEGSTFDMDDARTIWTILFKKGIFQVSTQPFRRPLEYVALRLLGTFTRTPKLGI